ncbi:hypothetical protein [Streptomyces noursei]|uniref:hypothetical protein n=1 Tax=Streptomyces noursei TaxID=1971 RepID=UPI001673F066|nr:hypothetical protein [Streptomyces noursei]GGX27816.1 hypothetical protein GCM10010341_56720 [Streptomyces noursei]
MRGIAPAVLVASWTLLVGSVPAHAAPTADAHTRHPHDNNPDHGYSYTHSTKASYEPR